MAWAPSVSLTELPTSWCTEWSGVIPHVLATPGDPLTIALDWTGTADVDVELTVGLVEPLPAQAAGPGPYVDCFGTGNPSSVNLPGNVQAGDLLLVTMAHNVESFGDPLHTFPDGTQLFTGTVLAGTGITHRTSLFTVDVTQAMVDAGVLTYTTNSDHGSGRFRWQAFILRGAAVGVIETSGPSTSSQPESVVALAGADFTIATTSGASATSPADPSIDPDREPLCAAGAGSTCRSWLWEATDEDTVSGANRRTAIHVRLA